MADGAWAYFSKAAMFRWWLRFLLVGVVASSCFAGTGPEPAPPGVVTLRLAAGMEGTVFHDICAEAETLSQNREFRIQAVASQGSWESLTFLRDSLAEFALAQMDAIVRYLRYEEEYSIIGVRPLYTEYLHIVVREPLELFDISGIEGKRVFLGRPRSGTAITASVLMDISGVSTSQCRIMDRADLRGIRHMFKEDSLDIAMHVGSLGNRLITELLHSRNCRLFSLSPITVRRMTLDMPQELRGTAEVEVIPAETYPGQTRDINVVATPIILVADADIPPQAMGFVDKLIAEAMDSVRARGEQGKLPAPDPLPIAPAEMRVFDESIWPPPSTNSSVWLNLLILGIFIVAMIFLLKKYSYNVIRFCRFRMVAIVLGTTLFIFLACALGIYLLEHSVNTRFESIPETLWSVVLYLTSGLEDRTPITPTGRLLASVMLIAGSILLAGLIGFFASSIIINTLERNMAKNLKNHYLILNWSSRTIEVIKQIHSSHLSPSGRTVIVVMTDDDKLDLKELQKRFSERTVAHTFEDVYFCPGDPCDSRSLLNANVQDAETILIMADGREGIVPDEKTVRSLLEIQKIAYREGKKPHVVVELVKNENAPIIENIAANFPGTIDLVAGTRIPTLLLAQATIIPGLTAFYRDLLRFSTDTNELYLLAIPPSAVDKTFPEYASRVLLEKPDHPMIPVGLYRGENGKGKLISNPMPRDSDGNENPAYRFRKGDKILVMSYDPPKESDLPN